MQLRSLDQLRMYVLTMIVIAQLINNVFIRRMRYMYDSNESAWFPFDIQHNGIRNFQPHLFNYAITFCDLASVSGFGVVN